MLAFLVGAAAIAGILVGFWLRGASVRGEKVQAEALSAERARDLAAARTELTNAQNNLAALAGFEALANEREKLIERMATELEVLRDELRTKVESDRSQTAYVKELETELRNERVNLAEKLSLLETAKKTLSDQFQTLAAEVLDAKSKTFSESSQTQLGTLLDPLKLQIKEFREKVEQAQSDSKTGVTRLETLIGTLGGLNQKLSDEAHNLSTALRGSAKAQGDWGELIARNLLEKAGLREGEQFSVQETFDADPTENWERQRKARPDVIVNLPGGRHLIIDSKVSLNAYTDSVNSETEEDRKTGVKRHLASVRAHVDELAERRYHKLNALESPDFVVMFIPIEPAFLTALHEDEGLWRYAYEKEVLLVGPTTLLFVIRIVDNLWQQELQARSVQDVMNRGAELYDKFVGFVTDLEAVGKSLRGADQSYNNAMKKLSEGRGNLIRQVELLKGLGVRAGKTLPRDLLDAAGAEESELALTAEPRAEEN